ncbi:MAG: hypothetical protein IJE07_08750 [Clostridia bacterium]|nr:hypothetical protein [Clostridia bacterium]
MKKLAALLLCLLMITAAALADIAWPAGLNPGQEQLRSYIGHVNQTLSTTGGGAIDVLHGLYPTFADLGMDGLELPDDPFAEYDPQAEISVVYGEEGLHSLTLRMQNPDRFALVAAACIQAASPEAIPLDTATGIASAYASRVRSDPSRGFEETINDVQSAQPRVYFAYYPDQYKDLHNWLQLTIIFARPGSAPASVIVPGSTPAPDAQDGVWLSQDNYNHLEVFPSATPEPDSAAME